MAIWIVLVRIYHNFKYILFFTYLDKFEETRLPADKKDFTNDLKKKEISDEDFEFIGDLWEKFNLQNLGELHDLYMETDVLLLADVMEGLEHGLLHNMGWILHTSTHHQD